MHIDTLLNNKERKRGSFYLMYFKRRGKTGIAQVEDTELALGSHDSVVNGDQGRALTALKRPYASQAVLLCVRCTASEGGAVALCALLRKLFAYPWASPFSSVTLPLECDEKWLAFFFFSSFFFPHSFTHTKKKIISDKTVSHITNK